MDIQGWETYKKNENRANLLVGIKGRYLLNIEANDAGLDVVYKALEQMDLDKLP